MDTPYAIRDCRETGSVAVRLVATRGEHFGKFVVSVLISAHGHFSKRAAAQRHADTWTSRGGAVGLEDVALDFSGERADEDQIGFCITTRRKRSAGSHSGREENIGSRDAVGSGVQTRE